MLTSDEQRIVRREATRKRICDAARLIFNERQYAKTSVEQIAREASLSVGAVYLFFRSKEDLFVSMLVEGLEETLERDLSAAFLWAQNQPLFPQLLVFLGTPGTHKQLSEETLANVERILFPFLNLADISQLVGNLILNRVFSCQTSIQTPQIIPSNNL